MDEGNDQSISVAVKQYDAGVTVTIKDKEHPAGQVFDIRHGVTPSFDIGEVMTLPPDKPATVSLKGTEGRLTFEFGIPKGRDGDNAFTFVHPLSRSGSVVSMSAMSPYLKMDKAYSVVTVEPGGVYHVEGQVGTLTLNTTLKQGMYGEAVVVAAFSGEPDVDGDNVKLLDRPVAYETNVLKVLFVGMAALVTVSAHW